MEGIINPSEADVAIPVPARSQTPTQLSSDATNSRMSTLKFVFQFLVFLLLLGCLNSSLTVPSFKEVAVLNVLVWKWFLLLMVVFSGFFVTHWFVLIVVCFIQWKFILRKNVVYFTHCLKHIVEVIIWISLVLATWVLLFKTHKVTDPKIERIIDFITCTIVAFLVGSFMWLAKTTLVKFLEPSFDLNRSSDSIQALSGRPLVSTTDNKTALKQLDNLLIAISCILVIILWLLLTEIASTKVLLFLSSQVVLAAFMFGNTCKTIFEGMIFVFVMHPLDVGDRCMIDGSMMIVQEVNILTTVFLKADNEKLYYPNAVLSTKPIGNYYRSPDQGDAFEFSIDYNTPLSKIGQLKERIKQYLELNPVYWHPHHSVVVKEIENVNKIKMTLFFYHTMNFQDIGEKNKRRSELVLEMKNIFDGLEIRYSVLPPEVLLENMTTQS